jgi:hypothetical protein
MRMGEQLSFSLSAADAGLHCYGASAGNALVLGGESGGVRAGCAITRVEGVEDSFELSVEGICEGRLEALGPAWSQPFGGRRQWLCRLRGASAGGGELKGFGEVTLGAAELGGLALRRRLWVCFDPELAFSVVAERRRARDGHGDEEVAAYLGRGGPLAAVAIEEPRLSSTYRDDGQLLRAGLELWEADGEDESEDGEAESYDRMRALRVAGETIVAGELGSGGAVEISVAFLAWHHDGRGGAGAYVIETAGR